MKECYQNLMKLLKQRIEEGRKKDAISGEKSSCMVNSIGDTEDSRSVESWRWITKGFLKKETEGLIFASQDQALRTYWIKKKIDGQEICEKCKLCGEREMNR